MSSARQLAELLSPRPTAKLQFGLVTEHLAEEVLVKERALLELVEQLTWSQKYSWKHLRNYCYSYTLL